MNIKEKQMKIVIEGEGGLMVKLKDKKILEDILEIWRIKEII